MPPICFRRFISGSLALAFVIHTCRAQRATFPTTLTTTAFDRSSSGWFAAPACTATAEDHQTHIGPAPPSLAQHRIQRLGLLHPASFNVRVHTDARKPHISPTRALASWTTSERLSVATMRVCGPIAGGRRRLALCSAVGAIGTFKINERRSPASSVSAFAVRSGSAFRGDAMRLACQGLPGRVRGPSCRARCGSIRSRAWYARDPASVGL